MPRKKIDYNTILACQAGDETALKQVLLHYESMINSAASRTVIDEHGEKKVIIDMEAKENIQQTLMLQIYMKYDHLAVPPQKKSKETA